MTEMKQFIMSASKFYNTAEMDIRLELVRQGGVFNKADLDAQAAVINKLLSVENVEPKEPKDNSIDEKLNDLLIYTI